MTKSVLTVFLPERAESKSSIPEPVEPKPSIVAPVLVPAAAVTPKVATPLPTLPAMPSAASTSASQDRSNRQADGVAVVLRVNADGEVTQIFWDRLPAIDNEQFNRLEAIVRMRRFGPNVSDRSITEIIDVRALLNLPPAQSPAPTINDGGLPAPTDK